MIQRYYVATTLHRPPEDPNGEFVLYSDALAEIKKAYEAGFHQALLWQASTLDEATAGRDCKKLFHAYALGNNLSPAPEKPKENP